MKYVAITRAEVNLFQTDSPPEDDNVNYRDIDLIDECDLGNEIDDLPF